MVEKKKFNIATITAGTVQYFNRFIPKSPPQKQLDFIDYPANDNDIDGIYRYLAWHMNHAGLSSNCFHFLEVLKQHATKK
jgi:hypothetical protein